jgi:hypothetical protein
MFMLMLVHLKARVDELEGRVHIVTAKPDKRLKTL